MGGKPRIPGKRSLQVIERVRRQLEATDHELGSVGDFIDRFGAHDPDPNATTDRLHNLNRQRSRLARQLRRRIERLKQKQPGALEVWV
ncbi:MAG: hypothetical protein KJO07_22855, partial [Deltaproteobacteria bacterium]|nr:hypothetical protein [Deltaproteobacteria bacterium]